MASSNDWPAHRYSLAAKVIALSLYALVAAGFALFRDYWVPAAVAVTALIVYLGRYGFESIRNRE